MMWFSPLTRGLLAVCALALAGLAGFAAYAWQPAFAPVDPPVASRFGQARVRQGEYLAKLGNCGSCHTVDGQPAYGGGVPIETPFGTIYGSNLTPEPETGIGRWSEAAFIRAMRQGVDRNGRHLYPAFPYDHFTRVSDDDDRALYAYLMTRQPFRHAPPPNDLTFPLNFRPLLAGWKFLFFRPGAWRPDPTRDPGWNRGTYLVEGLGHCGACHTPRNRLGAEKADAHLAGGVVDGWNAYPLNDASPAPIPWTVDAMADYLGQGWAENHGVSRGPMAAVTLSLAAASRADREAIGTAIVSAMGVPSATRLERARALKDQDAEPSEATSVGGQSVVAGSSGRSGAALYLSACASCHEGSRPLPMGGLPLAKSSALYAADPGNIVIVTLQGLMPKQEDAGAIMPGFAGALDDRDLTALLAYLRETIARAQPWPHLLETVSSASAARSGPALQPAPVGITCGSGS